MTSASFYLKIDVKVIYEPFVHWKQDSNHPIDKNKSDQQAETETGIIWISCKDAHENLTFNFNCKKKENLLMKDYRTTNVRIQ